MADSYKIILLLENTGYNLVQVNGQRIFRPPPGVMPLPPHGSEVFVSGLPENLFEDKLVPIFATRGVIYEMRLMINFSGQCRGYAFVRYSRPEHAQQAIDILDNFPLRRGCRISVMKSVDNRRLFLGHLPQELTRDDIYETLTAHIEGITNVIVYPSFADGMPNRGYAFVEFEDHRRAAVCRRNYGPKNDSLFQRSVVIDWSDPLPDIHPSIMDTITNLYVRNLKRELTNSQLWKYVIACGVNAEDITKIHKIEDYAFVHFKDKEAARVALSQLNGQVFGGQRITAEWARPPSFAKKSGWNDQDLVQKACVSVPPRLRRMIQANRRSTCTDSSDDSSQA